MIWLNKLTIVVINKSNYKPVTSLEAKVLYQKDNIWQEKIISINREGKGYFSDKLLLEPEIFIIPCHLKGFKPIILHKKIPWYQKTLYIECEKTKTTKVTGKLVDSDGNGINNALLMMRLNYPLPEKLKDLNEKTNLIFDNQSISNHSIRTSLFAISNKDGLFEFIEVSEGTWFLIGQNEPIKVKPPNVVDIGIIPGKNVEGKLSKFIFYRGKNIIVTSVPAKDKK